MPSLAAVPHLRLELEDYELLAPALVHDLAKHFGSVNGRVSNPWGRVISSKHQHAAQLNLGANFNVETLDLDDVARLDLVLLSARLEDCVHDGHPYQLESFVDTREPRRHSPRLDKCIS